MSVAEKPPALEDADFGAAWSPLGEIPISETHLLKELRLHREGKARPSRALHFYLDVDDEVDRETLPERFWLGFDEVGYGNPTGSSRRSPLAWPRESGVRPRRILA